MLGMLNLKDCRGMRVLSQMGCDSRRLKDEFTRRMPSNSHRPSDMTLSNEGKRVIDLAYKEAKGLGDEQIGTHHILLGVLGINHGVSAEAFRAMQIDADAAREVVRELQVLGEEE
jgi:ATP-dependent Clp protease ATP-binding subunit ClpC